jgi:hypothetical protein
MGQSVRAIFVQPHWGLFRLYLEFNFGARWLNKSMDEVSEGALPYIEGHFIFCKFIVSWFKYDKFLNKI